jgi:DNA-binding NarL/FixJ family response regulator
MNNNERGELQDILVDYVEDPRKMGPCILKVEKLFRRVHNRWAGFRNRETGSDAAGVIMDSVCTKYHLAPSEIRGTSRSKILLDARLEIVVTMHIAGFSYSEIARTINRHQSTITHTLRKAGRLDNGS